MASYRTGLSQLICRSVGRQARGEKGSWYSSPANIVAEGNQAVSNNTREIALRLTHSSILIYTVGQIPFYDLSCCVQSIDR